MNNENKKIISNGARKYFLASLIIIGLVFIWHYKSNQDDVLKIDLPAPQEFDNFVAKNSESESIINNSTDNAEISETVEQTEETVEPVAIIQEVDRVNLAVPFTSQAPTANWDQPFQDACEEASLLMVAYYYQDKNLPTASEVEDILISMVEEQRDFTEGSHRNITAQESGELAQRLWGYRSEIVVPLTAEKIRDILRDGRPIIVPADGHILANPYFSGDGPDYHMLVIKGFVDDKFITNDPGTKRGEDFIYTEENLMAAIFDWDKEKALTIGPKIGLVLYED